MAHVPLSLLLYIGGFYLQHWIAQKFRPFAPRALAGARVTQLPMNYAETINYARASGSGIE